MTKVLGLGDNVCDVYLHENTMYPGGQALNFSVFASKLGVEADYMGIFGQDPIAEHVRKTLDAHGIGHSHCRSYPGENGFARVTLVDGDRVFKGSNRGGVIRQHPLILDDGDLAYAAGFDLIHTTNNGFLDGLLPTLSRLRSCSDHPVWISYDFSSHWTEEDRVKRVCPYIDFAFLSASDLNDREAEELCRRLHQEGCRIVTATRGSKGAVVFEGGRFYTQAPDYVEPLDTMGAGDSFATAMLVSLCGDLADQRDVLPAWKRLETPALQKALPKALKNAAAFAAKTCLVRGAFGEGVPVPDSLRDRIYAESL